MSEENWSFIRLGYNKAQQIFVLESHLSPIKVGRATFNDLQCKGELWIIIFKNLSSIQKTFFFFVSQDYGISRNHFEIHQYEVSDKIYWKILDRSSQKHTYVNGRADSQEWSWN